MTEIQNSHLQSRNALLLHFLDRDDPSADAPGDRTDTVGNLSAVPVNTFHRG